MSSPGYIIYNYRPRRYDLSSSEYIKKGNRLDITRTHGLGSGIYGVTTSEEREDETITPIPLINPIIIQNSDMDSNLSTISIWLIDMIEQTIKLGKLQAALRKAERDGDDDMIISIQHDIVSEKGIYTELKSPERINDIIFITNNLLGNTTDDTDINTEVRCKLFGAINGFIKDYSRAKMGDFLLQPINYFLISYGYDGIYNASSSGNTFARGSVAFININMRDQKQAFGSPYLETGKNLIYNGSNLDECSQDFVSTTPRSRRRQRQTTIDRVRSRSRDRDRVGSIGGSKKKISKRNKGKRVKRRTLRKNKH
jgi:hypothetical protein